MVLLFELNPSGLAPVSYDTPHLHIRLINEDSLHYVWTRLSKTTKLSRLWVVDEW